MKLFFLSLAVILGILYGSFITGTYVQTFISRDDRSSEATLAPYIERAKALKKEADSRALFSSRVEKVKTILAGTPLESSATAFVECGDRFGVNPSLLLAIAQHESSFGRRVGHLFNNAFGWGVHNSRTFDSWSDGVCHVAAGLAASYDLSSVRAVIYRYAPPTENQTESYIKHVETFIANNKI